MTWVKLGHYRWWPARVLHPSEVPANIEKLKHDVGEFPIQFCGSNEYAWMNRGRSFLYEENDSEKVPNMDHKGGLDGAYKRGLSEAAEFFEKYSQVRFLQLLSHRNNFGGDTVKKSSNMKQRGFNILIIQIKIWYLADHIEKEKKKSRKCLECTI